MSDAAEKSYVPPAVRERVKKGEELHQQLFGQGEGEQAPPQGEQAPPQPQQPVDPLAEAQREIEKLEARYKTLQGKYNAELPALRRENQSLNAALKDLRDEVEQLRRQPPAPQQGSAQTSAGLSPEVERELADTYGEDFVPTLKSIIQSEASKLVQQVTPRIERFEKRLEQETAQQRQDRVYGRLSERVPNWRDVNRDPEFKQWLGETDRFAGQNRHAMMLQAFESGDAERVAHFFEAFLNERKVVEGADTSPANRPATQDLARYVSPTPSRQSVPNTQSQPQNTVQPWTRRQIKEFYERKQSGYYRNDPATAQQMEESIFKAVQAGAVQ